MRGNDSNGSSKSSHSNDSWPYSPKPQKPQVTELVDKGSQPTPSSGEGSMRLDQDTTTFSPTTGPKRFSFQPKVMYSDQLPKASTADSDSSSFSEQISIKLDDWQSQQRITSQTTVTSDQREVPDDDTLPSFINKFTTTAKMFVGKGPVLYDRSQTGSNQSQRDVLLDQVDEMDTTALIKQYDKKEKSADKDYIKLIVQEIVQSALEQISSNTSTGHEMEEERELASLDITRSRLDINDIKLNKDFEKEELETSVTNLQSLEGEKDMLNMFGNTQDRATSTASPNKPFVRVRYEEDYDNKKLPVSTDPHSVSSPNELSITEQSSLTQDSDIHVTKTPETEEDETSHQDTASNESDKKKFSEKWVISNLLPK